MVHLTKEEERKIIIDLINSKEFFNGSSRIVAPYGEDRVIKFAVGFEGKIQNENEYNAYTKWANELPLAKIYAKGDYILIMEKVDVIDYWDIENGEEIWFEDNLINEDVWGVVEELGYYFGETSDNQQVGINKNGDIVAYDYGFILNWNKTSEMCGKLDYGMSDKELINVICEELEFINIEI